METLRCKLRVNWIRQYLGEKGQVTSEEVSMAAVYSSDPNSENKKWADATPNAQLSMTITNPAAFGRFTTGHEFYVDIIPIPKA